MMFESKPPTAAVDEGVADRHAQATTRLPELHDGRAFRLRVNREAQGAQLLLSGELDIAAAPHLEDHLRSIEDDGVDTIVIDLAEVTFLDSSGLQAFIGASRRAAERGRQLTFTNCPHNVRRVFELTGTAGLLAEAVR